MAITAETLRQQARLKASLRKVTDAQTRKLVAAWIDAWDEIAPDLNAALLEQLVAADGTISRAQLLRSVRLRKALQLVADRLNELRDTAGVTIVGDLQQVVDMAGGAQASVIDSQLPPKTNLVELDAWSKVAPRQIDAIVRRSTQQITSRLKPLPVEVHDVIRRELIRGIAAGSNPKVTARRMVARAERRFNGALGLSRALNVARTETLDAHRNGALLGRMQNADVLAGWEWVAELDTRTCPSCWAKHGTRYPVDEPGPFDHQQGRCAAAPVAKSWRELGIDLDEPDSVMVSSQDVFDGLSPEDQLAILGPARHQAWAEGRFPMSDWSVRRTTDGWRDSYGVAPVPGSSRPGRSSAA